MSHELDLDLEPATSGYLDEDACKVIYQLQAWHQARIDKLTEIVNAPNDARIKIDDYELESKRDKALLKAGIHIALKLFEDFPVSVTEPEESNDVNF
ncbi:hypothetical protein [Pseudoalteromonas umbrosa]|uniref:hypothetical protein n=1 Tax=Pseudoalteromonas umbrosa TaxID=3048489 RepID=UPI0024C321A4|nr:hypothetical protein [Pseudoalteromonas sp. B95]MDK1288506.1 hypothetical protein [Pseudoalteromonas sp. B95]